MVLSVLYCRWMVSKLKSTFWKGLILTHAPPAILLNPSPSDVNSCHGMKMQKRGGGGGFGYKSKGVDKSRIFKHVNKGRGDKRQFSR